MNKLLSHSNDSVSVVLLAHNEILTIEQEILNILEAIIKRIPGSEIIVAEDGSTDGTSELLKMLAINGTIKHCTSVERKGYKRALEDALKISSSEYIFFTDTGSKHNINDFWKLYSERVNADLIVGRRSPRLDQYYRRVLTYFYNLFIRTYFGLSNVYDADCGFRLFNSKVKIDIYLSNKNFFKSLFNSEIVIRSIFNKLIYKEVNVEYFQREGTSRGIPPRKIFSVTINSIKNLFKLKRQLTK